MKSRQIKDEQKQLRPPKNLFLPHHPFFNEKWKRIQKVLQEKISDESSLLESYKTIHEDKNKNSWTVHSFSKFVSQLPSIRFSFFEQILPFIQGMILELPNLFPSATLPLSLRQKQQTIDLTRKQIACLLACSLFSLFENQPWRENQFNYPNFDLLFDHFTKSPVTLEKTKCILYYFQRMHERVLAKNEGTKGFRPDDIVRFHRRVLSKTLKEFEMELENVDEKTSLSSIQVFPNGTIEDDTFTNSKQVPSLQADFANKFIGGGVLRAGNVQEEIHFSVHTECLVSLLFCQVMDDNEAIYIVGAERFVETNGYARSFQVSGPFDAQSKTTVTPLSKEQIHEPALSLQKDNLYIPSLQQYTVCFFLFCFYFSFFFFLIHFFSFHVFFPFFVFSLIIDIRIRCNEIFPTQQTIRVSFSD